MMPTKAAMVACTPSMVPNTQRLSRMMKAQSIIFSGRDMGPISASFCRAISRASGLFLISGG